MSRIDELIAQYCPDGVEHKSLGELGGFTRGGGPQKKHLSNSGKPCIHYGQIYTHYGLYAGETLSFVSSEVFLSSRKASPGDVIIADTSENDEDLAKCVAWIGDEDVAVSNHTLIYSSPLNPKYVSYFLSSNLFQQQKRRYITGVKVRTISEQGMSKVQIPVPPLQIQEEIVRILDKFTQLEAELEAELEARRQQYEYYRSFLLENVCNAEETSIANLIIDVKSGKSKKSDWADDGLYPLFGSTGQIANTNQFLYSGSAILIARVGAYAGRVYVVDGDYGVSDNALIMHPNSSWNLRFAFHQLTAINLRNIAKGGGQPLITGSDLKKIIIKLPPLSEQERIVSILDKFDALVNDLSSGLPAEIAARRKQYEHYRDRLLSFKELS